MPAPWFLVSPCWPVRLYTLPSAHGGLASKPQAPWQAGAEGTGDGYTWSSDSSGCGLCSLVHAGVHGLGDGYNLNLAPGEEGERLNE